MSIESIMRIMFCTYMNSFPTAQLRLGHHASTLQHHARLLKSHPMPGWIILNSIRSPSLNRPPQLRAWGLPYPRTARTWTAPASSHATPGPSGPRLTWDCCKILRISNTPKVKTHTISEPNSYHGCGMPVVCI